MVTRWDLFSLTLPSLLTMADEWVQMSGALDPAHLLPPPVEAGNEKDGVPLFIARANYGGGVHPGKAGPKIPGKLNSNVL